jgi:catechol 2,3-dioxygenase-like lactoylglutathione lyase family enzyme
MNEQTREWPGGIAAVTLFVDDLVAARTFYREVFGLEVVYEDEDSAVFKFGDTLINLLLNGPMDRPWGVRTASFRDPGGHIWEIAR